VEFQPCKKHEGGARGIRYERLVLDRHGLRVYSLFAGDTFQSGQNASIVILVALDCEAALFVSVGPGQSYEMFFGLTEGS